MIVSECKKGIIRNIEIVYFILANEINFDEGITANIRSNQKIGTTKEKVKLEINSEMYLNTSG